MQLQLTGQITGIEARNGGWFAVVFMEQGAQYPKKLSTKKPELVQQAQQMIGQWADALYNEQESTNINPNNGQPYTNRYLEALSMAGTMPQQPVQQQPQFVPQPQPQAQNFPPPQQQWTPPPPVQQGFQPQPQAPMQQPIRTTDDVREARIMRQAAGKVAAALLPMLSPEDQNLASLIRISEQLVQYFRDGVQWNVPPVQPQGGPREHSDPTYQQPQAQQQHQAGYENPADAPAQAQQYYGEPDPDDGIPF